MYRATLVALTFYILQISVLVYVASISSAATHDSNKPSNITNTATSAKERIPPTPEERAEGYEIVQRLAKQFSINYFKKRAGSQFQATVLSPLSFFILLSMLSYGAKGAERDLFLSAIGLRQNETRIAKFGYKRLVRTLSHYNMNVSAKVYYTADLTPVAPFVTFAKNFFNADLGPVSVDDVYISTEEVNGWVMNQTHNQSAELFPKPLKIGPKPSIALVNTVYFKAAWESPFDSSITTSRPFHIWDKHLVYVPTMQRYAKMPYGRIDAMRASFVELPLKTARSSDPMSMFIILPDERHFGQSGSMNWILGELEKFDWENLRNTTMRNVNLYLPKFKSAFSDLQPAAYLNYALGAANPFNTQVTLKNMMMPSKPMSFGNIAMKYVIEVNEDGDMTTGSSGIYYKKNELESVNRNVRAIEEETDVVFIANRTFLAVIAMKGDGVFQGVAIVKFNGYPFLPETDSGWAKFYDLFKQ